LFDADAVEREPYMAPGLVSAEKAARGKRPTDVWFHTIVPTNGREKTGYPTQKPEGVLRRMVAASSRPGGWCLDPFAGSGTLGAVCQALGRRFVLVDSSPVAVEVMRARLGRGPVVAEADEGLLGGAVDERDELNRLELPAN
jgi:site-specific DNA-methyltransferase (adenine-specific)